MKKHYFLVALFALALTSVNAQFVDDMESYTVGSPISGDWWTDWGCGGGAGCAIMSSDAQANDGSKSGLVPSDGTTDAVLDLGNKIFGTWYLTFYMYVPSNQEGYWNLQGTVPIGAGEWIMGNFFFNQDLASPGVGSIDNSPLGAVSFDFPHDQWFAVELNVDISLGISLATCELNIAGNNVIPAGTPFTDGVGTVPTSLGGIDFFSISANNLYYVDSLVYSDNVVGTQDFSSKGFSVYPNPVNNILNLQANESISNVAIYNVLGQEVYSAKVNAMTSQVDMSQMASGAYFVKVNINGTEGTVKVIK
jgi:Secretion system C-terminal sorting domain